MKERERVQDASDVQQSATRKWAQNKPVFYGDVGLTGRLRIRRRRATEKEAHQISRGEPFTRYSGTLNLSTDEAEDTHWNEQCRICYVRIIYMKGSGSGFVRKVYISL